MTSVLGSLTICSIMGREVVTEGSGGLSPTVAPKLYIEIPQITCTSSCNKHASDSECNKRADCGSMIAFRRSVNARAVRVSIKALSNLNKGVGFWGVAGDS